MPNNPEHSALPQALSFDPWWRHGDPPWILQILDKSILTELALIHAETQRALLEVQLKAADRTVQALSKKR